MLLGWATLPLRRRQSITTAISTQIHNFTTTTTTTKKKKKKKKKKNTVSTVSNCENQKSPEILQDKYQLQLAKWLLTKVVVIVCVDLFKNCIVKHKVRIAVKLPCAISVYENLLNFHEQ
jgi:hypothetical protein